MVGGTKVGVVVAVAFLLVSGEGWAAKKGAPPTQLSGVVNLNTATAQQLDLLPGVGQKAAKAVVDHRAKAPFGRVEELVKVKGFGKKRFEKLKSYLSVSGPTTLTQGAPRVQGRAPPPVGR